MSGSNENSSKEEYSDSASESEEDITTLLSSAWNLINLNLNEKVLSHKGILVLAVMCGVIVINIIARKERVVRWI